MDSAQTYAICSQYGTTTTQLIPWVFSAIVQENTRALIFPHHRGLVIHVQQLVRMRIKGQILDAHELICILWTMIL